jgi:mannose-6-phosphate isomerase-like protein (cupin superfamily)
MRRSTTLRAALLSLLASFAACQTRDVHSADSANAATDSAEKAIATDTGASIGRAGERDTVVEYYTAAVLAHVGDSLARGSTSGHLLRAHPTYQYLQIRRDRSGVPEVHDRWTDVTIVQAGRATLVSGGRVTGSRVETPGEHRGGTITGGATRSVGAGDLMVIPAGIPHQYVIAAGDSLRYVTVKVLRSAGSD